MGEIETRATRIINWSGVNRGVGEDCVTVRSIEIVWSSGGEEDCPMMVRLYVVGAAEEEIVNVRVEKADVFGAGVTGLGEELKLRPFGVPVDVRSTEPAKPFSEVMFTRKVA